MAHSVTSWRTSRSRAWRMSSSVRARAPTISATRPPLKNAGACVSRASSAASASGHVPSAGSVTDRPSRMPLITMLFGSTLTMVRTIPLARGLGGIIAQPDQLRGRAAWQWRSSTKNIQIPTLRRLPVDVLLINIDQPDMAQIDTWAAIHVVLPRARIAALTTGDDDRVLEMALGAGVGAYGNAPYAAIRDAYLRFTAHCRSR